MDDQDDDFWTTYIASTPEQDQDFAGVGRLTAWIVGGLVLFGLVAWLLH
ncbi:MAG TPA: hypothetical protein VFE46_16545 [Pirellulales bacterium]|jgi:hypothetical protein|nr:hypothetical protein [Pirellulales bacterium]